MNSVSQKQCSKCGEWKPLDQYYKHEGHKDGLHSWCKSCLNVNHAKRRKENPGKDSAYTRLWRKTERGISYAKSQVAKKTAWMRVWRESNREKEKARHKKYKENHSEIVQANRRSYEARKKSALGSITAKEWLDICNKFGNKCLRCGRNDVKMTMDHIVPLSKGGTHTADNVQPLCLSCNSRKRDKYIDYR
jgi:5-methylcytosine-specific restriction endonuclease McrA